MDSVDLYKVKQYIEFYADEFSDNPKLDFVINDVGLSTSKSAFGDFWHKAVALKAAHELYLATLSVKEKNGEIGVIVSKKIGPVSIAYDNKTSKSDGTYALSIYGRMYLELEHAHVIGINVVDSIYME